MNPRYKLGVWLGVRNKSADCFIVNAEGVFRAREIRTGTVEQMGQRRETINSVFGG